MSKWLVTGVAGFVGSNLLEELLKQGHQVTGLDNFTTGKVKNLEDVKQSVGSLWNRFDFIEGDITDQQTCFKATAGVDYVLHQAALISVPESFNNVNKCIDVNIKGFTNILGSSKTNRVKKLVYASSCAVEKLQSPYAISKLSNELFSSLQTDLACVGLRYFNVYGARQDRGSLYSAVIPKWIAQMMENADITVYGDGSTTRDFVHISDVVKTNIRAATEQTSQVINVGTGVGTSLNNLLSLLKDVTGSYSKVVYKDFRHGDILHSVATDSLDDFKDLKPGIIELLSWYKNERKNISN